jgi:hypothetical protein
MLASSRQIRADEAFGSGGELICPQRSGPRAMVVHGWPGGERRPVAGGLGPKPIVSYGVDRDLPLRCDHWTAELLDIHRRSAMSASRVRCDKAALSSGCKPHRATAPAGSNRSGHGGDEMAEAFVAGVLPLNEVRHQGSSSTAPGGWKAGRASLPTRPSERKSPPWRAPRRTR